MAALEINGPANEIFFIPIEYLISYWSDAPVLGRSMATTFTACLHIKGVYINVWAKIEASSPIR